MADTQESEKLDDPMKNYEFDGQTYIYTDKTTGITYKFDQENNKWVVKENNNKSSDNKDSPDNNESSNGTEKKEGPSSEVSASGVFGFENDTHTYTDSNDGSVYFWDKEKSAWFPKVIIALKRLIIRSSIIEIFIIYQYLRRNIRLQVDEDFMARYQMSYGFTDDNEPPKPEQQPPPPALKETKEEKEQRKVEAKRKAQEPPSWFEVDEAHNTAIYVSGLPLDITMDELTQLFAKCGLIARDEKGRDKIKLYKDAAGEPKGDALCTYIKVRIELK